MMADKKKVAITGLAPLLDPENVLVILHESKLEPEIYYESSTSLGASHSGALRINLQRRTKIARATS